MYYSTPNTKLYHNNSLELLKKFPNDYFDLIFADPPYFLSNGTFTCQNGKKVSVKKADWDLANNLIDKINFHTQWITACKRILKTTGSLWVSETYHSIFQCGYILQNLDFKILNDIVWFKPNASPNLSCRMFTASHETLIWARKDHKTAHYFNYEYSKQYNHAEDNIKQPNQQMRSVWRINSTAKAEKSYGMHPTQKPIELLNRIILSSTKDNDIILDPFNGSGTTGYVSVLNNRRYVGIDVEQKYLDITIKRLESIKSITPCITRL